MAEAKSFKDLKLIYNKGIEEEGRDARRPDDAKDVIPITHAPNTIKQKDYAMPLSQIGVSTVGTCATEADEQIKEVSVIRGSFPFNTEKADEAIGREILVKFTNKNTADSPKIKIGNMEAMPIVCIGGTSIVGEGCWEAGATMKFTSDGENWLMHSNVASKTKSYTILADGTTIYTKPQTDSAINGALSNYEKVFKKTTNGQGIQITREAFIALGLNDNKTHTIMMKVENEDTNGYVLALITYNTNQQNNVISKTITNNLIFVEAVNAVGTIALNGYPSTDNLKNNWTFWT